MFMRAVFSKFGIPAAIAAMLAALVWANVQPYSGNVSAMFHLDELMNESRPVPKGFAVLTVPAYDGAHYYQIARNIPAIASPDRWPELLGQSTLSYAYQRILLPAAGFILAVGQEAALPYTFLLINVASLLIAAYLIVKKGSGYAPYAAAVAFCPSAMVGLHFMLAEPLSLLLLTVFLLRFSKNEKLEWFDVLYLSLLPLSREVNVLFVGTVFLYVLWKRQWKDVALCMIPFASFFLLHGLIFAIFGDVPFLMSTGKTTYPFQAVFELITGVYGYNRLTLTSIPLFLFFVLPGLAWTAALIIRKKDRSYLAFGSLMFLILMTLMPDHIWGSITSIGRVITPVYPLTILLAARHDTWTARWIASMAALIGLAAGWALALNVHPFIIQ